MALVSIIMSVYNGEKYLKDCIESILFQTLKDLEFIITDDCSSDESLNIILEYKSKDNRIKLIKNDKNIGLTKSLNNMLDIVNSKYIARMDADDISLPTRLEKQVEYMDRYPDVGVCAVAGRKKGSKQAVTKHTTHEEIKTVLLFRNAMPHSSIMIRGNIIYINKIRYNEDFKIIQDYELWSRLINITEFSILGEILFEFNYVENSVTATSAKITNYREKFLKKIYGSTFKRLKIDYGHEELEVHYFISSNKLNSEMDVILKVEGWLLKILNHNNKVQHYNSKLIEKNIASLWYNVCTRSSVLGIRVFLKYYNSEIYKLSRVDYKCLLKLFIKCLIKYKAPLQERYI